MAAYRPSLLPICVVFVLSLASSSSNTDSPTVDEILPKFGLPRGLLPSSVLSYTLDENTGAFTFLLDNDKPCYIQFDYLVYYNSSITGLLRYGSITQLKGIDVRRFFIWLHVNEIKVDLPPSDSIYFQVSFINKRLDLQQFNTLHACLPPPTPTYILDKEALYM